MKQWQCSTLNKRARAGAEPGAHGRQRNTPLQTSITRFMTKAQSTTGRKSSTRKRKKDTEVTKVREVRPQRPTPEREDTTASQTDADTEELPTTQETKRKKNGPNRHRLTQNIKSRGTPQSTRIAKWHATHGIEKANGHAPFSPSLFTNKTSYHHYHHTTTICMYMPLDLAMWNTVLSNTPIATSITAPAHVPVAAPLAPPLSQRA